MRASSALAVNRLAPVDGSTTSWMGTGVAAHDAAATCADPPATLVAATSVELARTPTAARRQTVEFHKRLSMKSGSYISAQLGGGTNSSISVRWTRPPP